MELPSEEQVESAVRGIHQIIVGLGVIAVEIAVILSIIKFLIVG